MKIKKISIIILTISIIILSTLICQADELHINSYKKDYRNNPGFLNNNGEVNLGFIIVDSSKAIGMPDQHNGVILNANITFSESTHFIVIHIPLVFIIDSFNTSEIINLHMDFFVGRSDYQSNLDLYRLIGFARGINWIIQ